MANESELRNESVSRTKRLPRTFFFQVMQAHPLSCLAVLFLTSAAVIPIAKPARSPQPEITPKPSSEMNAPPSQPALPVLRAAATKPAKLKAQPAAPSPRPQTPTGPPNAPVLFAPTNGSSGASTSPTLDVSVTDPAGANLSVTFYGKVASTVGPDFTVIALPDTQYYSSSLNGGTPAMFNAQTQWIVNNQNSLNIAYVAHLGDIVQHADNNGNTSEWSVADNAMKILENANIPYGVHPGNHDEGTSGSDIGDASSTVLYNTYFGISRFSGRSYYGGHYGSNNNNHYDLFSAGGMNFIAIYFAFDYNAAGDGLNPDFTNILAWAQGILKQYSDRHAILVSHYMMGNGNPANLSIQGGAIVNGLDGIPNVFLTLAGHYNTLPGEGQRTSVVSGNTVQGLMSDYQDQPHGGNGWLRIMTFSPANNQISVQTYSPVLNQYMTDAASQFTLPWNMQSSGYTNLGTVSNVASGGHATMPWNNLSSSVQYQWYAVVSNGTYTTTGPTWSFTTGGNSSAPAASFSPTSLAFGNQLENSTSSAQNVSLTNTGNATLVFQTITASQDYSESDTCGAELAPKETCTISVTFDPTVSGTDNGSVTFTDNAPSGTQTIALTGSGVSAAPVANLSTTSLNFGNQQVNTSSASQSVKLTNTGNSSLSIQRIVTSGDYAATSCPSSLGINASCTMNVTFTPTATGTRSGSITITDNAGGSPQVINLTGVGTAANAPGVTLSPTGLNFGSQLVNTTSASQNVTLTNTGTATLSISSMVTSGNFAASSCPSSLAPNAPCTISVTFTPTATGTRTGSITITDNASGSPQTVSLTGVGTAPNAPAVTLSPTSLTFGNQLLNTTSASQNVTLTNTGTATLSISGISTSGDFKSSLCPSSLAPNTPCTINVTFTPTATGTRTGSITITDNASGSPQTVKLTGTGASSTSSPAVKLTPTSISFGFQPVGTSTGARDVIVTNVGTATLIVSQITTTGDFSQVNDCSIQLPNRNCAIQIKFRPTVKGVRTGILSITDNVTGSPQTVPLVGTGN